MQNMKKKNWITALIIFIVIALIGVAIVRYSKPTLPVVQPDGSTKGNYALKNIMALKESYECSFTKSDEVTRVVGTLQTDGSKIRGDFDISLTTKDGEKSFASHLIVIDNQAYSWTSLQPVGYKTRYTGSANKNATPEEQGQMVGKGDVLPLNCVKKNIDQGVFNIPEAINFIGI